MDLIKSHPLPFFDLLFLGYPGFQRLAGISAWRENYRSPRKRPHYPFKSRNTAKVHSRDGPLFLLVAQITNSRAQCSSQPGQNLQRRIPQRALQVTNISPVCAHALSQFFLRPTKAKTQIFHLLCKISNRPFLWPHTRYTATMSVKSLWY